LLSRAETKTQKQKNLEINSPFLDRKIEETAAGLPPSYAKSLRSVSEANPSIIIAYIATMKVEITLSDHYRKDVIDALTRFSKYTDNKSFKDITRDNIISFLESFRKPEVVDRPQNLQSQVFLQMILPLIVQFILIGMT
jgi:hypothetical protein